MKRLKLFRKKLPVRWPRIFDPEVSDDGLHLLFVSHEATRTGAPKIILRLLQHFAQNTTASCETLLHNGGTLISDFQRWSPVHCVDLPRQLGDSLTQKLAKVLYRRAVSWPRLALCNSMESRFIAQELHRLGIPIVFLVHELPSSYQPADFATVYQISDRVIFPVDTVRDSVLAHAPAPAGKTLVMPQGLIDPDFGKRMARGAAREAVCRELGIPEESFIVLGCGSLDLRKGIDHFASVARTAILGESPCRPFYFIWVGDGPRWTHSPWHYVEMDIRRSVAPGRIRFIGERSEVDSYFVAADSFLLSSRVDPFPCVVHEAMAVGLPVVAFDQSGGAVEALRDGAGVVVPYADHAAAAAAIARLRDDGEWRAQIQCTARRRVEQDYRFADYAEKVAGVVESVLGESLPRQAELAPAETLRRAA